MSNKDGVKSITKEVIVIRVHKTSNKERFDVKESETEVQYGQDILLHK